jgi:hypothetical protein
VRERHDAGHVPDGPDPVGRPAASIDGNASGAHLYAERVEPVHARPAARRHKQLVCRRPAAVGESDDALRARALDPHGLCSDAHVDPLLAQPLLDQLTDSGILAW